MNVVHQVIHKSCQREEPGGGTEVSVLSRLSVNNNNNVNSNKSNSIRRNNFVNNLCLIKLTWALKLNASSNTFLKFLLTVFVCQCEKKQNTIIHRRCAFSVKTFLFLFQTESSQTSVIYCWVFFVSFVSSIGIELWTWLEVSLNLISSDLNFKRIIGDLVN